MRVNTTKEQVLALLQEHHFMRLETMQAELADEVDFSTVYRNVQQLVAAGTVKKVVLDSKVVVYELASHHHDHFVCDVCQRVEIVTVPTMRLGGRTVRDIVIRGECAQCTT